MYINKTTQNELIECCGKEISNEIIKNVKEGGVHNIISDETTDIAHQSQLSLSLGYLHGSEVREDFIEFINIIEVTKSTKCDEEATPQEPACKGAKYWKGNFRNNKMA